MSIQDLNIIYDLVSASDVADAHTIEISSEQTSRCKISQLTT